METEEIKNIIDEKIEKIKLDRTLLTNLLLTIDSKEKNDNINDQLIDHISNMEFNDDRINEVIEYITLVITNLETQKINNTKKNTEELLKILEHILSTFKSMETCLHKLDKPKSNTNGGWKPNGKIASTVLWVIVLIVVLFGLHKIDDVFYHDIKSTAVKMSKK